MWRENRSNDYKFFNDRAREQFTVGGTGINIHKYLGSDNGDGTSPELPQYSNQSERDPNDFWIEEYGRVMEKPSFPVPAGKYLVTGGRQTTTVLTVMPPDASGRQGWSLEKGALFDVTHLPCRSARYTPSKGQVASPSDANELDFPVKPGAAMPPIPGCQKQDYAVLFVLAVDRDSSW